MTTRISNRYGLRNTKIELVHHGEDYWKLDVDGVENEIGEFEGNVIKELLRRLEDNANTKC